MPATPEWNPGASPLGPLLSAVIEALGQSVVVLDRDGRVVYASESARSAVQAYQDGAGSGADLVSELLRLGGRKVRLQLGQYAMGDAVLLPSPGDSTLAERERQAILQTLRETGWRLAVAARHLGISRTTLWRRLKEYGVQREDQ